MTRVNVSVIVEQDGRRESGGVGGGGRIGLDGMLAPEDWQAKVREALAEFRDELQSVEETIAGRNRSPDPERDLSRDVIVTAHHHPYARFFSLQEIDVQVRQYDGGMSDVLNRAAVLVGEAAVVLPYDPVRDCVLLVEQFRAPVFMAGDPAPWIWEPVAGLLEPGEAAETAARREALEETGLTIGRLESAGEMYSSTGSSTEYLHLFVGFADLGGDITGTGGTDEGEDIRSQVISYEALMQGVDGGRYKDMPLVTTALWLARHRDRLRGST